MPTPRDPVLFLSIYLHKQNNETPDARAAVLQQVDSFAGHHHLHPVTDRVHYPRAAEIELNRLDEIQSDNEFLFRAQTDRAKRTGTFYECMVYARHDAIAVQIQISKFSDWRGSFADGWHQLTSEIQAAFDPACLESAASSVLGLSMVYWTLCDGHNPPRAYETEVHQVADAKFNCTETDLGLLWRSDWSWLSVPGVHQDFWVFVSPRESKEILKRYYQPYSESLPPFGEVALARHKISFQLKHHRPLHKDLELEARDLTEATSEFLDFQRQHSLELDELLSDTAIDFEKRLSAATNVLGRYRNKTGQLKEMLRTIEVNRRNYLIHCVELIGSSHHLKLIRSWDREQAAKDIIDSRDNEEIFGTDLGAFGQSCRQLDTDLVYAEALIRRHAAALQSGTDQLRIAGERDIAEVAHHMSVDSAAVVASLAALVVIELVVKPHLEDEGGGYLDASHMTELWLLIGSVVFGVYGLTRAVGARFRGENPGRKSFVFAFALFLAWGMALLWNHDLAFSWLKKPPPSLSWTPWISWTLLLLLGGVWGAFWGYPAYKCASYFLRRGQKKQMSAPEHQ